MCSSGYVPLEGDPGEDSGHVGGTRVLGRSVGIPLDKLKEVAREREVWVSLLRLSRIYIPAENFKKLERCEWHGVSDS